MPADLRSLHRQKSFLEFDTLEVHVHVPGSGRGSRR
jgi:hypothetical protein